MKKVSIVIPMYCEEQVVNKCYERLINTLNTLKDYEYEIIFVNDRKQRQNIRNIRRNC